MSEAELLRCSSGNTDVLMCLGRNYGSFIWLKFTFNCHQSVAGQKKKQRAIHLESENSWRMAEDVRIRSYTAEAPVALNSSAQPVNNRQLFIWDLSCPQVVSTLMF